MRNWDLVSWASSYLVYLCWRMKQLDDCISNDTCLVSYLWRLDTSICGVSQQVFCIFKAIWSRIGLFSSLFWTRCSLCSVCCPTRWFYSGHLKCHNEKVSQRFTCCLKDFELWLVFESKRKLLSAVYTYKTISHMHF